ncbi:MAG: efflux RND transporter periplasmic adaptor subunit [Faecalibacterium sp.]
MNWKKKQSSAGRQQQEKQPAEAERGPVPFVKKNWKWLVPVICVVVVGGAMLTGPKSPKQASAQVSYVETRLESRDVSNTLSGTGTLNPANKYTVKSLVAGKILTADFEEGDTVEEGRILYTVDSSDATTNVEKAQIALEQAQRNYQKVVDRQYVRAEVGGTVSSLKVTKGDEVTSGQEVAVIRDSETMLLTLEFPAADAAGFSVGQSAEVILDGTFEVLNGVIKNVTGTDALSTGNFLTRTVTIAVHNEGGLTTAQAATARINGINSISSACFLYQAERTLTAKAAGTVTAIHVKEGDTVDQNTILIELWGDDLNESIQSASESLRNAEISMKNMQDTMNNYTITSPISGTVVEKDAKQGDLMSANSTMCVLYDMSYLEMIINVDELQISSLSVGQTVQVTADAVPDKTYTGKVTRVSLAGSTSGGTTTYPVTIRIDSIEGLRPGMNANAEIVIAESKNALVVPNAAVVRGGYVLVSTSSPSAANAAREMQAPEGSVYVPVTVGVSDDDYTEILSGLQEGDTILYSSSSLGTSGYYSSMGGY